MTRSRLDNNGSVAIGWNNDIFTEIAISWEEELDDGTDTMRKRFHLGLDISDLSVGDIAKLTTAVNLIQGLRDTEKPLP